MHGEYTEAGVFLSPSIIVGFGFIVTSKSVVGMSIFLNQKNRFLLSFIQYLHC